MEKGKWIYWKFKEHKTYNKSYIQEAVKTTLGLLLEFSDTSSFTNHPNRVLSKDIDILIIE